MNKAVFSGSDSWLFMGSDTNRFLERQFYLSWDENARKSARRRIQRRIDLISEMGAVYKHFIIPEKSVVYQEKMPEPLASLPLNSSRPATRIQSTYLLDAMMGGKWLGQLCETGGTHITDLGAYVAYSEIAAELGFTPLPLCAFRAEEEGEAGDLSIKAGVKIPTRHVRLVLKRPTTRKAKPPKVWLRRLSRPLVILERNADAPRAVIFRDSMTERIAKMLAEHFSRSTFIWRRGQVYRDVIEKEKPDFVIQIMTERFVTALPEHLVMQNLVEARKRPAAGNVEIAAEAV